VLGFARPRPPSPEPLDLSAITKRTVELVRHDVERSNIRLETKLDDSLPLARADPQQVQQVLLNLFRNAIQAMAETESPWLRVEVLGIDDRLAVRVSDGGPGIPVSVRDKIFDPFFSTKSEGSGLGLSVSFAIARAHGGDLRVATEIGRGTTFTLLLPIGEVSVDGHFERILLVDDEPEVADALSAMLAQEGAKIFRAESGAEALPMLETESWDAVFLDVRLPDLSGPEVYERLREMRPELARRVVFVTGGLWRRDSRLAAELPPQPILAKPCTHDQVREVLRQLKNQRSDLT
jgi:two-component system NtrC family sensor kinase